MSQIEPGGSRRIVASIEDSSAAWLRPPPYHYRIVGFEYDGEFDLGFKSTDPSPAHPDVVPESVYSELEARLEEELDLETLRAATDEEAVPFVGHCTIEDGDDTALEATIRLADEFLNDG